MRKSIVLSLAAGTAVLAAGAAYGQTDSREARTRAEVEQRTTEMFGRMDANKDGVLNAADREAARREAFDAIDADKDGALSFAEFEARRDQRGDMRSGPRGPDGAGVARRGGPGGPAGLGGRGIARAADSDNDGTVTQTEFITAALARFDQADANGDGSISVEERRATRQQMRQDHRRGRPARDAG